MDHIDTTMAWPGFRQAAARMGLHASLSVPLFAGSGATIAVLNLYGHDPVTLVPLSAGSGPSSMPTRRPVRSRTCRSWTPPAKT